LLNGCSNFYRESVLHLVPVLARLSSSFFYVVAFKVTFPTFTSKRS
jgi:hypothetical protein